MPTPDRRKSVLTSTLVTLALLLPLSTFVMSGHAIDDARLLASGLWTLYLAVMVFAILRTGRTKPWRSIFFIIYAFSFIYIFISDLIASRGSMALTEEIIAAKETPLCPVAIPQLILPALLKKLLIFPTKIVSGPYGGFWTIMTMWLVGFLALGRGWCSWVCFYGGIDEGFSRILRRPLLRIRRLPERLRYLPHAVLALVVVWSFLALGPVYCSWFCPLKLVTEYPAIDSPLSYVQAVVFITLGMGLLFILPLLTKRRTQCGLFCPMGAMQSLMSPVNPYRVRVDAERCRNCGRCVEACPTFSMLPAEDGGTPRAGHTCTRCGECMSVCREGAIDYALVGVPTWRPEPCRDDLSRWRRALDAPLRTAREIFEARTLFVGTAVVFGATISGSFVTRALVDVAALVLRLFGSEVG